MVVVVILNYNDGENCLKVARNALHDSNIDKAIIVDNCSPDGSYALLKQHQSDDLIVLRSDKNGGFAYGHNVGIRFAISQYKPEVLLTINSDIIVKNDVLDQLIEFIEKNEQYGLVSCAIREKGGSLSPLSNWSFPSYSSLCLRCSWIYRKIRKKAKIDPAINTAGEFVDVDAVRGSLMCFNGKALKTVEGFDEHTFLYFEENIMGKKMKAAGYKVAFLPQIEYFHNHKQSAGVRYTDIRPSLESAYYYATTYGNVKGMKKVILKACTWFGIKEQNVITGLKRKMTK